MKKYRPPVPQLGEAAVSRIERNILAELDGEPPEVATRPRRWPYGVAMALGAAVLVVVAVRAWRPASPYPSGAQIATGSTPFEVAVEGATLELGAQSAVQFGKDKDGSALVVLDRGRVTCEVAPRSHRAPFVVQAGQTRVIVVGTRFTVERRGDHASVEVEHGLVEVIDGPRDERVGAGQSYVPPVVPVVAAAKPEPVAPPPIAAPIAPPRRTSRPAPVVAARAPAEAPAPPVAPAPVKSVSPQERFESAARAEASDPEGALRTYGELSDGSTAWAADALFAAGRLEAERGHTADARRLLQTYLLRFPAGVNAEDARELLGKLP